jgi:hypothetical protein
MSVTLMAIGSHEKYFAVRCQISSGDAFAPDKRLIVTYDS